ncbi:hypothetical protein K439DRAFT_1504349 [Ramaria rubella]|nr:hypothetical protein K439DRAFT_1504349 [Ramaria rubella]
MHEALKKMMSHALWASQTPQSLLMLLLWGTLQPHGASNLASVRFSGPVRIRLIRIHPKGTSLFRQNPEAISQTEPETFTVSIFLNAQAAPSAQEPKPKGTNVLVPTLLQYVGGLRDFPLDMGPDLVTRLMVLQGDFERVTLAVYGETVSEPLLEPISYEFTQIPSPSRHRLSPVLDPATSNEPSLLSLKLLACIPHAPSLSFVIRRSFCLKYIDEEWSSSRFASLEECVETDITGLDWLERATGALMIPVHEDVHEHLIKRFVTRIIEALTEKTNDVLYALSGLLRYASAQPGIITHTILELLDLPDIFELHLLDKHILERLHDAAANPITARALSSAPMLATLHSFRNAHTTSRPGKDTAAALQQRIVGWERFEKALSGPVPDVSAVALWMKELTSEDMTCGIFLLSMLEEGSLSKINRFPIQESPMTPSALWDSTALASFPDFVAFLRAFAGLSYMMAVLCWTDSISEPSCRERALAVVRLWQETDGYCEIVNHLILLPQVVYHLENILRHVSPLNPSIIYVEQILKCLCAQPEPMLRPELANLVAALPYPSPSIPEAEREEMEEIAMIAEGGLSQVIKTLSTWSDRPVDTTGSRALRAALLNLEKTLDDRYTGEWNVMQTAWREGLHGLVFRLVEIFGQLVASLHSQFLLSPPPPIVPSSLAELFSSSIAAMRILARLLPGNPLPNRSIRALVQHTTTLFIATDAVDSRYPQGCAVRRTAQIARPTCADTLSILSSVTESTESSSLTGELVLRTLFQIAMHPEGDDPAARLEQVFWLIDLVLPLPISDPNGSRMEERFWTKKVIPNLLPELKRFSASLANEHRAQFVERLALLDRGEVGLGQWLVDEEVKHLLQVIESMKTSQVDLYKRTVLEAQVSNSAQFLLRMMETHFTGSIPGFLEEQQVLQNLARIFAALSDYRTIIPSVVDLACCLAPRAPLLDFPAKLEIALTLIRNNVCQPFAFIHAGTILPLLGQVSEKGASRVATVLGPTLHQFMTDESRLYWVDDERPLCQAILSCLNWLAGQSEPNNYSLLAISEKSFSTLLSRVITATAVGDTIQDIRARFVFSDEAVSTTAPDVYEPFTISYDRLHELLTARPKTPPTPRLNGESIFKMATMSPVAALVGSSRTSTLTKTYQNNDFRQLSVRQNTSRRPSMHVDVGI